MDEIVTTHEQRMEKASDELALAYQQLMTVGVGGVVLTVKK